MASALVRSWSLAATLSLLLSGAGHAQADARRADTRRAAPLQDTLGMLAAGAGSTCLTTTRGAGWCWGTLAFGRRGVMRMHDEQGRPVALRTLSPWGTEVCGLSAASEVLCDIGLSGGWTDSLGRKSEPPVTCRDRACLRPLARRGGVPSKTARLVSVGGRKSCALAPNGKPYCWGGDTIDAFSAPFNVSVPLRDSAAPVLRGYDLRFSQLALGSSVVCGLTEPDRAVHCWGNLLGGQPASQVDTAPCPTYALSRCEVERRTRVLPEGTPREQLDAWQVRFAQVSAGAGLACGVDIRGDAYCWGSNYRCALGRCRTPDSFRAQRIAIAGRVAEIGAGFRHACARTVDGRIFCWGDNTAGQLGSLTTANAGPDGLPPDYRDATNARAQAAASYDPCFSGGRCSPAPVEVSPDRHWSALAVGGDHSCALASDDGAIYCWGGSDSVALGGAELPETCVNRSRYWQDVRCQPYPVRVAGLPRLAPPTIGVDSLPQKGWVRVMVSRREMRAEFRPDTTRGWGWPQSLSEDYRLMYVWSVSVPGMDGPQHLGAWVSARTRAAREFPSLSDLVKTAEPMSCGSDGGMLPDCRTKVLHASAGGGVVTLVLQDSAQIARLFGMRPAYVQASETRPDRDERATDSVRVEYVAPFIPEPTAATRADAARSRRRFEERITTIARSIRGGGGDYGAMWLVVGDSAPMNVTETHCTYDSCISDYRSELANSGWTVDDSTIARLQAPAPDSGRNRFGLLRAERYLKALRPGTTIVRVHDVHGPSDTAASSPPPAHELKSTVSVTLPVGRVRITPRPDTILVNNQLLLTAQVFDVRGDSLSYVPVQITVEGDMLTYGSRARTPTPIDFGTRGRKRIVARAANHADTLTVTVVDSLDLRKK